jgi:hypothetical protein
MYVSDERWRDEVSLLMKKAALVMLRIGTSEGFWWEIEQVVATVPPERVLFLLDWQDGGSAAAYERFRERARTVLPQPLPKQGGEALFLAFGSKWEPMFLGSPEHLFQGAALRDPAYIENDLAPLLQRYGIKPRRIGALGRGAVIIIVVSLVLGAVLISLML